MFGFKLNKYVNTFITWCGGSGYNPDDQAHKAAFHQGLNNLITRGGLRSQFERVNQTFQFFDHYMGELNSLHGRNEFSSDKMA
eukprot:680166-Prorocentrum_minimum.AAC.1